MYKYIPINNCTYIYIHCSWVSWPGKKWVDQPRSKKNKWYLLNEPTNSGTIDVSPMNV